MSREEEKKVKLVTLNEHITCHICKGYLIEATTIIECLHTFCKSCIVKHLNKHNTCPKCKQVIHQSHPFNYISFDRTMQDIVYKLVPGLERPKDNTINADQNSNGSTINSNSKNNNNNNSINKTANSNNSAIATQYQQHNSSSTNQENHTTLKPINTNTKQQQKQADNSHDYHRNDEQINLHLLPHPSADLKTMDKNRIRVSNLATINHLKKFLSLKLYSDIERYKEFDLLCNDNLLGNDHNLKFVSVTEWRNKVPPIKITYRKRELTGD